MYSDEITTKSTEATDLAIEEVTPQSTEATDLAIEEFRNEVNTWPIEELRVESVAAPTVFLSPTMILELRWLLNGPQFFSPARLIHRVNKMLIECGGDDCEICKALREHTTRRNSKVMSRYRQQDVVFAYAHVIKTSLIKPGLRYDVPILLVAPSSIRAGIRQVWSAHSEDNTLLNPNAEGPVWSVEMKLSGKVVVSVVDGKTGSSRQSVPELKRKGGHDFLHLLL